MSRPKPGDTFTHDRYLEPGWTPDRTQVWRDAPKARMVVTDVREGRVWYAYEKTGKGRFPMDQAEFLDRFGAELTPLLTVIDGGAQTPQPRRTA